MSIVDRKHKRTIIDKGYHQSYSFILRHNGKTYIMPEASQSGGLWHELDGDKVTNRELLINEPLLDSTIMEYEFNCSLSASCKIGKGTILCYGGMAVVVYAWAVIGKNCMIGQCVTIGGNSGQYVVPVMVKEVPSNCVVAEVSAKIIRSNIKVEDYR